MVGESTTGRKEEKMIDIFAFLGSRVDKNGQKLLLETKTMRNLNKK